MYVIVLSSRIVSILQYTYHTPIIIVIDGEERKRERGESLPHFRSFKKAISSLLITIIMKN